MAVEMRVPVTIGLLILVASVFAWSLNPSFAFFRIGEVAIPPPVACTQNFVYDFSVACDFVSIGH
jgi:hypothetical protein